MNTFLIGFLGALCVLPLAFYAASKRRWHIPFANGLLIATLIYVGFAAFYSASAMWIGIELAGVAIYGVFVYLGYKKGATWVATGWALHVLWDVLLHEYGAGANFVPYWYPPLCIGFDLAAALAIFALMKFKPSGAKKKPKGKRK